MAFFLEFLLFSLLLLGLLIFHGLLMGFLRWFFAFLRRENCFNGIVSTLVVVLMNDFSSGGSGGGFRLASRVGLAGIGCCCWSILQCH